MKKIVLGLVLMANIMLAFGQSGKRVLLFSKTGGFHHESIPQGVAAIEKLGRENNFEVYPTTDSTYFTDANLKKYAAIIFLNTSGKVLNADEKVAMQRYIEAGGGFMGIHCASATEKDWPFYTHLLGAIFVNHPDPQPGVIDVTDRTNPATKQLPARWDWKDEWYNFRDIQPDLHVLFNADETTYKGGTNGANHPLAWYHEYDGGRSFYTALGHFPEAYVNPLYLQHLLAGIQYAMGKNVVLNYNKVKTGK